MLGAYPLPVNSKGDVVGTFVTPPQLQNRHLTSPDVVPPPKDKKFHWSILKINQAWVNRNNFAWEKGCPVSLGKLRYVKVTFWGFDNRRHTGQLVVQTSVAKKVITVFRKLYDAKYRFEGIRLSTKSGVDAAPTGDGNDSGSYTCRAVTAGTSWSMHAYGLAVDINPFMNPYKKGSLVLPELASSYLTRSRKWPGIIHRGDVVYRAFASVGWKWGGDYRSLKDYMHSSANGR